MDDGAAQLARRSTARCAIRSPIGRISQPRSHAYFRSSISSDLPVTAATEIAKAGIPRPAHAASAPRRGNYRVFALAPNGEVRRIGITLAGWHDDFRARHAAPAFTAVLGRPVDDDAVVCGHQRRRARPVGRPRLTAPLSSFASAAESFS